MKSRAVILLCILCRLGLCDVLADQLSSEGRKLRNIQSALAIYMASSNGNIPRDLQALVDYGDLRAVLRPEADVFGPFPERYTFLHPGVHIVLPDRGECEVLLLGTKPFPNATRGAVWRYADGRFSCGLLSEDSLTAAWTGGNLASLKPMGGVVPAPTHPIKEGRLTEYQAKILQLEKSGKLPVPTPFEQGNPVKASEVAELPSLGPAEIAASSTEVKPKNEPPARVGNTPRGQSETIWLWVALAGVLLITIIVVISRRRHS